MSHRGSVYIDSYSVLVCGEGSCKWANGKQVELVQLFVHLLCHRSKSAQMQLDDSRAVLPIVVPREPVVACSYTVSSPNPELELKPEPETGFEPEPEPAALDWLNLILKRTGSRTDHRETGFTSSSCCSSFLGFLAIHGRRRGGRRRSRITLRFFVAFVSIKFH